MMLLRYALIRAVGRKFVSETSQSTGKTCLTHIRCLSSRKFGYNYLRALENVQWKQSGQHRSCFGPVLAAVVVAAASGNEKEEDSELIKTMKLAVLSIQKAELEKAERLLHIALRLAQEQANIPGITYIYDLLANIAFQRRDFRKAERLLQELLKRLSASSTDDNAFVEASLKLASVFASSGEAEKADKGFQFCIDAQRRKIDAVGESACDADTLGLWGMAVDWYARFLAERGQFSRARELTARALETCVRLTGEAGEQALVLLSDLATLDSYCGDHELAAERLARAVRLAAEHAHPDLAAFHVNLGMVRLRQGLAAEAERSCQTAQRLARKQKDEQAADAAAKCLDKVKKMTK